MSRLVSISAIGLIFTLSGACKGKDAEPEIADEPVVEPVVPEAPAEAPPPTTPMTATANLESKSGSTVTGVVTLTETDGTVAIRGSISGLEPGKHGFHIHENGDCSAPDASSAGGHYNPEGKTHAGPDADAHHAGDLGNIEANEAGVAELDIKVDFINLGSGEHDVVGKAVVVHAGADDLKTDPAGDAGNRVACGVIQAQGM